MSKAIRRIISDLKENQTHPIDGVSVYLCDRPSQREDEEEEDLFTLHCNIDIKDGPYAGIIVHTILKIPEKYPYMAPAMNIAPDYTMFTHDYHEHIHGTSICNDMLSNYAWFFETQKKDQVASGWSSGYTLNVILGQMQVFFANDIDLSIMPSDESIERLRKFSKNYACKTCSQKRTVNCLFSTSSTTTKTTTLENKTNDYENQLVCGITKLNLSSPDIIMGYPIMLRRDKFKRMWPTPLLETMSYEAFAQQIQISGIDDKHEAYNIMNSARGEKFNYWIPIYVNEAHFNRALVYILNAISVIRNGITGHAENDFKREMILDVLPCLMNKTIVHLVKGTLYNSKAAIQVYCNFLRLYMRLIQLYDLKSKLADRVYLFKSCLHQRNKKQCGDLGEFLINAFLSGVPYEEFKHEIITESFTRMIYWIEKAGGNRLEEISSSNEDLLKYAFNGGQTSIHLFLFNIEMAKFFIQDCESKFNIVDKRCGLLPDHVIEAFQKRVVQIKNVNTFSTYISAIGFSNHVNSAQSMVNFLFDCKKLAKTQSYI